MTDFVTAECGIRQLHSRYGDAVWRKDIEAFGDCFTEDCEWRMGGMVMNGREAIKQGMAVGFEKFQRILMTFRTPILEVGDGAASGRTYVNETSLFADGTPFGPIGIYYERFVLQGDVWRFQWRLFHTAYAGPPDLSGSFFDVKDYGAPPAMPPLDEATVGRASVFAK